MIPITHLPRIRVATPIYSNNPLSIMDQIDLTKFAVVTQKISGTTNVGSVHIVQDSPGLALIGTRTDGTALCVLAQRYHPGWIARIGKREIKLLAVDGDLTGVVVPAGKKDVILKFRPKDFVIGREITLAALILAAVVLGASCLRTSRSPSEVDFSLSRSRSEAVARMQEH